VDQRIVTWRGKIGRCQDEGVRMNDIILASFFCVNVSMQKSVRAPEVAEYI
jgi:hypothetical protein